MPAADIWTTVASCSPALTLSCDDTVTSVLWVTNDVRLTGWTLEPFADAGSVMALHEESVLTDRLALPDKTDSRHVKAV